MGDNQPRVSTIRVSLFSWPRSLSHHVCEVTGAMRASGRHRRQGRPRRSSPSTLALVGVVALGISVAALLILGLRARSQALPPPSVALPAHVNAPYDWGVATSAGPLAPSAKREPVRGRSFDGEGTPVTTPVTTPVHRAQLHAGPSASQREAIRQASEEAHAASMFSQYWGWGDCKGWSVGIGLATSPLHPPFWSAEAASPHQFWEHIDWRFKRARHRELTAQLLTADPFIVPSLTDPAMWCVPLLLLWLQLAS